ncbi:PREDICTED: EF-hand calcium-binding domain-containing protein 10-like [Thamnophis sirtalis]|uniref:EF-hand calcium-binding domain-containing protein 10-like n=1 Tax=Thamnophis sirtalis TaxID=35019 RepID=A0A6I9Z3L3_9SAUR|nr:PREDICTED: EF-hand calcium-binding domain-containing protein 10-like [Thamnophis sirtalis]XP_032077144.1 EF-hand calcium-binding domain-containing protein 10 [Thamnophis elegans]
MDRETEGREYLAQHKIPELLYSLTSLLLYHRPERPREFLIKTLEKVKLAKSTTGDYPNLMEESNLDAMFDMIDVGGEGYINGIQYKGALESLGLSSQDVPYAENEIITSKVFKENVTKKFTELWTTV